METLFEQTQQEVLQNMRLKVAKLSSLVENSSLASQLFLESHQIQDNMLGGPSEQKMLSTETSIEILHAKISQGQEWELRSMTTN